jgi:hypothetical protein
MSKQLAVSEVPETTAVIRHGIAPDWDVVMERDILEMVLMKGLYAEQARVGNGRQYGSFSLPPHRGYIILRVVHGLFFFLYCTLRWVEEATLRRLTSSVPAIYEFLLGPTNVR